MIILAGILFMVVAAACLTVAYCVGIRRARKGKLCTEKTTGTVLGMSNFTSSDISIPMVEYQVGGVSYKVAGPTFAGSNTRFITAAGVNYGQSKTNITVDGELPVMVEMEKDTSASNEVMRARYPVGKTVDVFYDPAKPKRAYVERYAPLPGLWSLYVPGVVGLILLLVGILLCIFGR